MYPFQVPSGITVVPDISGSASLGSPATPFSNIYANSIYQNGVLVSTSGGSSGSYLPLTGGTLTGGLSGTSANFTGIVSGAAVTSVGVISGATITAPLISGASLFGTLFSGAGVQITGAISGNSIFEGGQLVATYNVIAATSGLAATANQTLTSSGAGTSLYNTTIGTTQYLNSISGLGTVTVFAASPSGVVTISGSAFTLPTTATFITVNANLFSGTNGNFASLSGNSVISTTSISGATTISQTFSGTGAQITGAISGNTIFENGQLVATYNVLASTSGLAASALQSVPATYALYSVISATSGIAATANQTLASSGAGTSLYNTAIGTTQYLNSISGLGTITVFASSPSGVVTISGSTFSVPATYAQYSVIATTSGLAASALQSVPSIFSGTSATILTLSGTTAQFSTSVSSALISGTNISGNSASIAIIGFGTSTGTTLNANSISGTTVTVGTLTITGNETDNGTINANTFSGTNGNFTNLSGNTIVSNTTISGATIIAQTFSGTGVQITGAISGNSIFENGQLVATYGVLAATSGLAATANQTLSSSGAGTSLYNTAIGTTQYINSISGLGTISLTTNASGVVFISGSAAGGSVSSVGGLTGVVLVSGAGSTTVSTVGNAIIISGSASGGGITGPGSSTLSGLAVWANTGGTAIANSPIQVLGPDLQMPSGSDIWMGFKQDMSNYPSGLGYYAQYDNINVQEGYVNIYGTEAPSAFAGNASITLEHRGSGTLNYPEVALTRSRFFGNNNSLTTSVSGVIAGDDMGHFGFWGSNDISGANYPTAGWIRGVATDNWSPTNNGMKIQTWVTDSGTTTTYVKVEYGASGTGFVGTAASPIGNIVTSGVNFINAVGTTETIQILNVGVISGNTISGVAIYQNGRLVSTETNPAVTNPSGITLWSGSAGGGQLNSPTLIDTLLGDVIIPGSGDIWQGWGAGIGNNNQSSLPSGLTMITSFSNQIVNEAYINFYGTQGPSAIAGDASIDLEHRGSGTFNYPEYSSVRSRFLNNVSGLSVSGVSIGDDLGHFSWWGSSDISGNYANPGYIRGVALDNFVSASGTAGIKMEHWIQELGANGASILKLSLGPSGTGNIGTPASPVASGNIQTITTVNLSGTGLVMTGSVSGLNIYRAGVEIDSRYATISGENFTGAITSTGNISGASINSAGVISGATITAPSISGATYIGTFFSGATFVASTLFSGAAINSAGVISGASIIGATISGTTHIGTFFSGASIIGATISGTTLVGTNISGTNIFLNGQQLIASGVATVLTKPSVTTISGVAVWSGTSGGGLISTAVVIDPSNNVYANGFSGTTFSGVTYNNQFGMPLAQITPKTFYQVTPLAAATLTTVGGPVATVRATFTEPAWTAQYGWGQNMATSATAGNDSAWTPGANMFAYTSGTTYTSPTGFNAKFRFSVVDGIWTPVSGVRMFVGMTDQTTNVPTQTDFFAGNNFGLQFCSASGSSRVDTTFQIYGRGTVGSGITNTTLAPISGCTYDLYLQAAAITSGTARSMGWKLVNITSGISAQGTVNTNLPLDSAPMGPYMGLATWSSGTSTARNLRWAYAYVETSV